MMPKGLVTQLGMVAVSIGIVITYIQPAFGEVEDIQNNIATYKTERDKVVTVNSRLSELMSDMGSVSNDDQRRLLTYMPDSIDEIAVSRDLLLITLQAGILYKDVKYGGLGDRKGKKGSQAAEVSSQPHVFMLSVEGTYEQLKNLFRLLEQNNYPLEVQEVSIGKLEGGFLSAEIRLVTYAFKSDITNDPSF